MIMTCKSFCFEKKQVYNCNLSHKALRSFICLLIAMAGQKAESNGLNFSKKKLMGTLRDDIG